ncbi:MAG: FAD-binding protein [Coriobacteriales bacterium]|jgi:succinate dehydrogenase/fumarate reductase flavoprotein subunit
MKSISRRNFVRDAAGAAAAGALAAGPVTALAAEKSAGGDGSFDEEYDVVVLGKGAAGMNAAVAAYEEGAKVLLCEKAPEGEASGNTRYAGQNVLSTDDADAFFTYLTGLMGKFANYDEDCLRAYADAAAKNWEWSIDTLGADPEKACPEDESGIGTPDHPTWVYKDNAWGMGRGGWVAMWNEFPELEGNESSLNILMDATEFDASYFNLLCDAVSKREGDNLVVWYGAPGKELITDEDGNVTGVVIDRQGTEVRVGAKGGVCLCCGGFESNKSMLASYAQLPYLYPRAGQYNEGDGIVMAEKVGAQLWHMSNLSGLGFGYRPEGSPTAVSVNGTKMGVYVGPTGGRFMNETARSRHGRVSFGGAWNMTPMPMPAYLIVDADHISDPLAAGFSDGNSDEIASGAIISGETIEELSQNIRAAGKAPSFNANGELDDALAKYNAHVEAAEVDDFGRECTEAVKTGPFYALELCPTLLNTQGGPRHSAKAEVIDTEGMPIGGLFSGGELGSIFPDMYNGGGNLGETMIFGRIAGANAAKRAKGTFEGTTEPVKLVQDTLKD